MTIDLFAFTTQTAREAFPVPPVDSRPCEVCPKTAWFTEQGPDGLRVYMCANGHLKILAPLRGSE